MLVFKSSSSNFRAQNSNYPISSIHDIIDGTISRSSWKGWVTAQMFMNFLSDPKMIQPLDSNSTPIIWIDYCCIHHESMEIFDTLRLSGTKMRKFQPNCQSTV